MKISKILLGAAMFIAAPVVKGGCQMMAQNAPQEPIVVDTPFVHDPVMAYENGKYYLYCTGHGITQMTSTDRKHWTIVPQGVLKNSEIPAWTHDSVPGFTTHIWAPDVIRFKNKWYLAYSCSTFGKNTSAIGLLIRMDGRMRAASSPPRAIETTGMPSTRISLLMRRGTLGLPGVLSGMVSR